MDNIMDSETNLIDSAFDLWSKLISKGGIDLEYYDSDLVSELSELLNISPVEDFERQLAYRHISADTLIRAFFYAVKPFTYMMQDLLAMYERAGAHVGNDNLQIRFNFGGKVPDLDFDLENFRKWIERWTIISHTVAVREWSPKNLWRMVQAFNPPHRRKAEFRDTRANEWMGQYNHGVLRPAVNLPPPSVSPILQPKLDGVWVVLNAFLAAFDQFEPMHDDLSQHASKYWAMQRETPNDVVKSDLEYNPADLSLIESDWWAGALVSAAYTYAEGPQTDPTPESLGETLDEIFSSIPESSRTIQERIREIIDFLNLPIWKRRYELYSAWVGSQIVAALGEDDTVVHQADGKILYRFTGTHLATCERVGLPRLEVIAELRSPLANPKGRGRKHAIQPDYRVVHAPWTAPQSTVLAIECKQYRKSAPQSFAHALDDYARGCANAEVVLVNYGPITDKCIKLVAIELQQRTHALGHFRPDHDDSNSAFRKIVQDGLSNLALAETNHFKLTWGERPKDLDLHLWYCTEDGSVDHISYEQKGCRANRPWAELDTDVQNGRGPETIRLARLLPGTYYVAVHYYSDNGTWEESQAVLNVHLDGQHLRFEIPARSGEDIVMPRGPFLQGEMELDATVDNVRFVLNTHRGSGRWWHVLSYTPAKKSFRISNAIRHDPPFEES